MNRRTTAKKPSKPRVKVGPVDAGGATRDDRPIRADDTEGVQDGRVLDFISGTKELKDTPKEHVRQRIARALFHEYGISVEDMEADFSVSVGGRKRRVDIAYLHRAEYRRCVVADRVLPLLDVLRVFPFHASRFDVLPRRLIEGNATANREP